ncbi:glycosyltransferase family 2 protein [Pontimicrobium sp. MEBiC06410]
MKEQIVINMPLKNGAFTLVRAINSILNQKNVKREIIILIGNDNSTDTSLHILKSFTANKNIKVHHLNFNTSYKTRNYLLNYTRLHFPNCVLIGRLDCDDYLYNNTVLSAVEKIFEATNCDVLIAGNKQGKNNVILKGANKADKRLLNNTYLKSRLYNMSIGKAEAELPSCNTFIKPSVTVNYPEIESAEDHWFTIELLLNKERLNINIAEHLIYCVYSLDGNLTENNLVNNYYYKSRKALYQYFINQLEK